MSDQEKKLIENNKSRFSRRNFLKITGTVSVGILVNGILPDSILISIGIAAIPASEGYLLVDTKKCQGCMSCMLACSLVHEGKENLSLSRIQIIQNSFEKFPIDIRVEQCRQCVHPTCVEVCPTGALRADAKYGNVRMVDVKKCIGCRLCIKACTYEPSRMLWNFEERHAMKCDLCVNTPFWNEQEGTNRKQACVEVCPVRAIKFTKKIPLQTSSTGYKVNLRGEMWKKLGYPID